MLGFRETLLFFSSIIKVLGYTTNADKKSPEFIAYVCCTTDIYTNCLRMLK